MISGDKASFWRQIAAYSDGLERLMKSWVTNLLLVMSERPAGRPSQNDQYFSVFLKTRIKQHRALVAGRLVCIDTVCSRNIYR